MNELTRKLKEIKSYCNQHREIISTGDCYGDCVLRRYCINGNKVSRYNDSRFVDKCYKKVERALEKEREEDKVNPFDMVD